MMSRFVSGSVHLFVVAPECVMRWLRPGSEWPIGVLHSRLRDPRQSIGAPKRSHAKVTCGTMGRNSDGVALPVPTK